VTPTSKETEARPPLYDSSFAGLAGLAGVALDLDVARVEAFTYRCPVGRPIRSAFETFGHRQTVFVRIQDKSGHEGWGEAWSNFPPLGAEHRANLVHTVLRPLLLDRWFPHPPGLFESLCAGTHKLSLQCGESGPFSQAIAAVDIACWDLVARRANQPLWRLLDGRAAVPAYASGLEPPDFRTVALQKWDEGYRAFKLKIGFDAQGDLANIKALREALPPEAGLMADVNQGWTLAEALVRTRELEPYGLQWLEEPLASDSGHEDWRALQQQSPVKLAAGENLRGAHAFDSVLEAGYLRVFQPDIGKWGGVSGCHAVGKKVVRAGLSFCPHWLGAGIGQMASMHVLSAVGGPGMLEIDSKPNPLREEVGLNFTIEDGMVRLPDAPGVCGGLDPRRIERFRVSQ